MIMNLPISPFIFVYFFFIYFEAMLLGIYTHFYHSLVAAQEITMCTLDLSNSNITCATYTLFLDHSRIQGP